MRMRKSTIYCKCDDKLHEMIETGKEINLVGGWAWEHKCPNCGKIIYKGFEYTY